MSTSIPQIYWPRAESNLSADLKRLAIEGLADATVESVGRRSRTTYRITARGRRTLSDWLESPGDPPAFESEALLKLGFATSSTKAAALSQVRVVSVHAAQRFEFGRSLATEYLNGEGPLPERLHINAVMWKFLWEMHRKTARWAEWARDEIDAWPDTGDSAAMRERGSAVLREAIDTAG